MGTSQSLTQRHLTRQHVISRPSSCSQDEGSEEESSQGEGQFFWQAKVQGHGDRRNRHPEGEVRVFLERHQEPPGQQVQGGCLQEGGHPQQAAICYLCSSVLCACHSAQCALWTV